MSFKLLPVCAKGNMWMGGHYFHSKALDKNSSRYLGIWVENCEQWIKKEKNMLGIINYSIIQEN